MDMLEALVRKLQKETAFAHTCVTNYDELEEIRITHPIQFISRGIGKEI